MELPTAFPAVVFDGCEEARGLRSGTAEPHAKEPVMDEGTTYVGTDVHKRTIAVSVRFPDGRRRSSDPVRNAGSCRLAQPCRQELSGVVRPRPGCLQDPPRSPLHACSEGRKTRREARMRRTRFSARHIPRPESGRGRSEVERRPPPDEALPRRLFAAPPQLQHSTPLPRPSHERRPLPDSGRGRMSTDCARDVLPGRGVVIR